MSEFRESVLQKPRSFKMAFLPMYCCIISNALIGVVIANDKSACH
jgi:hypothetical protein